MEIKCSDYEEAFTKLTKEFEKIRESLFNLPANHQGHLYLTSCIDNFLREEKELFGIAVSLSEIDLKKYLKESSKIQYDCLHCFLEKSLDLAKKSKKYSIKDSNISESFLDLAENILKTVPHPKIKRLTTFNLRYLSSLAKEELENFPNLEEVAQNNKKRYRKKLS